MVNVLRPEKQNEIRALGRLGWSLRRIEEATGVRRETIGRYLKNAGIDVRLPRGRQLGGSTSPKAASETFADTARHKAPPVESSEPAGDPGKPKSGSGCEIFRDRIERALEQGRNIRSIWQELVDDHGYTASYESVKRFVRKLRGAVVREAHPTITTAPGEEAQVDYGTGPMVRDEKTGKYRRTRLFVLTLGCSRRSVWLLSFQSSSEIWCRHHEEAFRRLGGVPAVIVLDNLKEGVIQPHVYDPTLNPLYESVLAHYGTIAIPARVRHPDRKGKVERAVAHAQETAFKGRQFESLEEAQAFLDHWASEWANKRIHGTTKRRVDEAFEEERPHLRPLPTSPFSYFHYGTRTVHLDGCVEVDAAYYGAPPGWLGRKVHVQWDALVVRLVHPTTGELLREHQKQVRGHRTVHPDDVPSTTPPSTEALLGRAAAKGRFIGEVCQAIHAKRSEAGVRSILGVLSLAKKHGIDAAEKACAAATECGVPTYRFVRKWIDHHPPPERAALQQIDPLIRELTAYRDLFETMTQSQEKQ